MTKEDFQRMAWDKRHAMLAMKDQGMSVTDIARRYCVKHCYANELLLRAAHDRKVGRERP